MLKAGLTGVLISVITHVTAAVWKVEIMKNRDINLKHKGATPLIKNTDSRGELASVFF